MQIGIYLNNAYQQAYRQGYLDEFAKEKIRRVRRSGLFAQRIKPQGEHEIRHNAGSAAEQSRLRSPRARHHGKDRGSEKRGDDLQ